MYSSNPGLARMAAPRDFVPVIASNWLTWENVGKMIDWSTCSTTAVTVATMAGKPQPRGALRMMRDISHATMKAAATMNVACLVNAETAVTAPRTTTHLPRGSAWDRHTSAK